MTRAAWYLHNQNTSLRCTAAHQGYRAYPDGYAVPNARVCPPGMPQGRPQNCGTARGGCFLPVVAPRATRQPLPRRGSAARALSPLNLPRVVPRHAGPFCEVRHAKPWL